MPLHNFGKMKNNLYRGAQPHDLEAFKTLRDLGVARIFKLNKDDEFKDAEEQSMFSGTVHLTPLPALIRPHLADQIISIVHNIESLRASQGVFFHCTHGRDRTGLVAGAWRIIYDGWTVEEVMVEHDIFSSADKLLNWILDHTADAIDVKTLKEIFDKVHSSKPV